MRYLGGKSRLAKKFAGILDEALAANGGLFVEPFVGGCNVLGTLKNVREARCSDLHNGLINMYKALQGGWDPPDTITEEQYKSLRLERSVDHLSVFASFACSFSAKEWGGYARGHGRNYAAESARSLRLKKQSMALATFSHIGYEELEFSVPAVIYCDPPYQNTTGYKTGQFDSREFFDWCEERAREGHSVFVSEFAAPDHWEVVWQLERPVTAGRARGTKRKTRVDKLYRVP